MTEILLKMALNTIILILFVNITEIADDGCSRSRSCVLSKIYMYIYLHYYITGSIHLLDWVDTSAGGRLVI
jgi:hypothetical protein